MVARTLCTVGKHGGRELEPYLDSSRKIVVVAVVARTLCTVGKHGGRELEPVCLDAMHNTLAFP
jgi:hypothetical protein